MNDLIIGYGEIGKAVNEVIGGKADIIDVDRTTPGSGRHFDVMHVCIPYKGETQFLNTVMEYMTVYEPDHVVIYSTVAIGTTEALGPTVVHSPVEGKHPNLAGSIQIMPRWVGANSKAEGEFFEVYYKLHGLKVRVVESSNFTEFLKLRSTSKYGINIMWTDYEESVAADIGMEFDLLNDFDRDYNQLYRDMGMDEYQRYILSPPNGKIGGHCVVPNAKILNRQYPNYMLGELENMG